MKRGNELLQGDSNRPNANVKVRKLMSIKQIFFIVLMSLPLAACIKPISLTNTHNVRTELGVLEIALVKKRNPVVVLENGLGTDMMLWDAVFREISKNNTVIAYNRAGHGNSSAPKAERSGQNIVSELRGLLKSQGLQPPYVLVGHSAGGLYMQLFARQYPAEVAGLVLVDSTNPKQFSGPSALENQSLLVRAVEFWYGVFRSATVKDEYRLLPDTGRQMLRLPSIPGRRVTLVQAAHPVSVAGASSAENAVLNLYLNKLKTDEVSSYPGCSVVTADTGHSVPSEMPGLIVKAASKYLRADIKDVGSPSE